MKNASRAKSSSTAATINIVKIAGFLYERQTHKPADHISNDTLSRTCIFFHHIPLKTIATIALAGIAYINTSHELIFGKTNWKRKNKWLKKS